MRMFCIRRHVFIALALMLTGCSSNNVEEVVYNGEVQKIIVSVKDYDIDDSSLESRTFFDSSDNSFSWLADDMIGIFPENGAQLPFAMSSGAGTSTATISGGSWGLKASEKYAAYYPFSKQNYFTDRSNIHFSYEGQEQTGNNSTVHLGTFDLMAADNAQANGDNLHFEFKHLGCIFNLKVTVPYAGTYSSVALTADEALFETEVNLDLTQKEAQVKAVKKSKSVTLILKEFTTPSDNYLANLYLMCSPCDLKGKTIKLKLKSANGYTYSCDKTLSKVYMAGNRYGFTFNSLTQDSNPPIGIGGEFETSESEM